MTWTVTLGAEHTPQPKAPVPAAALPCDTGAAGLLGTLPHLRGQGSWVEAAAVWSRGRAANSTTGPCPTAALNALVQAPRPWWLGLSVVRELRRTSGGGFGPLRLLAGATPAVPVALTAMACLRHQLYGPPSEWRSALALYSAVREAEAAEIQSAPRRGAQQRPPVLCSAEEDFVAAAVLNRSGVPELWQPALALFTRRPAPSTAVAALHLLTTLPQPRHDLARVVARRVVAVEGERLGNRPGPTRGALLGAGDGTRWQAGLTLLQATVAAAVATGAVQETTGPATQPEATVLSAVAVLRRQMLDSGTRARALPFALELAGSDKGRPLLHALRAASSPR